MKKCQTVVGCVLLILTVIVYSGCSKKEEPRADLPDESAPAAEKVERPISQSKQEDVAVQTQNTLDDVLKLWKSGRKDEAAELFVKIDWKRPDIFDKDSIFGISESEFVKLPKDKQTQISQQSLEATKAVKAMAKYLVELGKEQNENMEVYRKSLLDGAERLSADDQLLIVQIVGQAVTKYTEKELLQ